MSKLKAASAAWLVLAVLLLPACTSTKPHTVSLRVPAKPDKTPEPSETPEETEPDDPMYYGGPAVQRKNLPLAGTKWEWEGNLDQERLDGSDQPGGYRLEFKHNGWFDFQADCKHGTGIFEITGQRIALAVMKATHSACHRGSKAEDFLVALEGTKSFRQADGKLYFDIKGATKTMIFAQKP